MALGRLDIIMAADMAQLRRDMSTATGILKSSSTEMSQYAKQATNSISSSFGMLKGIIAGGVFAEVTKEAIKMADTFNLIEGRLSLVTNGYKELTSAQTSLFAISQNTRQSLESTTDLYTRIARSTKDLGKSQSDMLQVTESINKSFIISGSSAQSANAAIIQLGQGFASGRLAGDELRSVLENAPRLAEAIAQGMGKSVGALRSLGAEGKLTAEEVFKAIQSQSKALSEEFSKMPMTVSQSILTIKNSLLSLVGEFDKATSSTQAFSDEIRQLSKYLDENSTELIATWQFISATTSRTIDVFNLLYETVENTGQIVVGHINLLAYGSLEVILTMLTKVTEGMNALGIASDKGLKEAYADLATVRKLVVDANNMIADSYKELDGAVLKLSPTIEDRIKEYNRLKKSAIDAKSAESDIIKNELPDRFTRVIKDEEAWKVKAAEDEEAYKKIQALAKKHAEEMRKFEEDQFALLAQNSEKSIRMLDSSIDYKEIESNAKTAISNMESSYLSYYEAIGDESKAFYLKEEISMQKLKDIGILTNSQMLEMKAKNEDKFLNEQFKKNNAWLYDLFENINKSLDSQFFDVMTGKFTSFGDWVKSLFKSIGTSIAQGLSRSIAGSITDSMQGGIVNMFKSYGGFAGVSGSLVGSTLNASDMTSLLSNGASASNGVIKTSGGTLIDQASGMVTSQGSDAMSLLSTASSLKSAYGLMSNGISGSVLGGFESVAGGLSSMGFSGAAGGLTEFGVGFASPFASTASSGAATAGLYGSGIGEASTLTNAGAGLSAGLMGAGIGYGVGSLGDSIFGAKTQAGNLGAVGGAIGSMFGPVGMVVGAVLGSVLGGFFGSKKITGQGIDIFGNASSEDASGQYYQSWQKKSWFSSKSWENYTGFSDKETEGIKKTIGAYDYLLAQLGEYDDLIVAGGRFSNLQSFLDTNVVKSFLTAINPQNLDTIYQSWVDYAKEIDATITEALASSIGGYTNYKRGYTEWNLGAGSAEQLSFTANYLQSDFEALASSLGASSVTVDNFLSMYDEAIKNNFTQDTIESWASLGDALMKATDANTKYQDALSKTTALIPTDMMLKKGTDATKVFQQIANDSATSKLMYAQMLKVMKDIWSNQTFGVAL